MPATLNFQSILFSEKKMEPFVAPIPIHGKVIFHKLIDAPPRQHGKRLGTLVAFVSPNLFQFFPIGLVPTFALAFGQEGGRSSLFLSEPGRHHNGYHRCYSYIFYSYYFFYCVAVLKGAEILQNEPPINSRCVP
jgi:hypothetical protein